MRGDGSGDGATQGEEPGPEPFDYGTLEATPDVSVPYRFAFGQRLESRAARIGIDAAISELNHLGHSFREVEIDQDLRLFREQAPDGRHLIDISVDSEGRVMVSAYQSWASWDEEKKASGDDDQGGAAGDVSPVDTSAADDQLFEAFVREGTALWRKLDRFDELTRPEQALLLAYILDMEVSNGGLSQYFLNTGGFGAEQLLECLRECSTDEVTSIVSEAIALVGPPFTEALSASQEEALQRSAEELDALDQRYFGTGITLPLHVMAWVEHHRSDGSRNTPDPSAAP